jgi:3-deoxy-D-manno-octulosonic-acid transferase
MLFYRLLISLLTPVLAIALFIRVLRRQERLSDFGERLGIWRNLPKGPVIWLHGASNGELSAARSVIEGILSQRSDVSLLITCNTPTARSMLQEWGLPRIDVRLAPIDLRWVYRLIMTRLKLVSFILVEADFWPNRLSAAKRAGGTLSLIGGRMSEKSVLGWAKFNTLSQRVFSGFQVISSQDEAAQARLISLGAQPTAFTSTLNLKSLYQGVIPPKSQTNRNAFWLAASTHETEDEPLLRAHRDARKTLGELRMILAPRHPKRADDIARIAQSLKLTVARRSQGVTLETPCDVFLADTLGEMETWYRAASICFVAGSLAQKGGHTPFEPAFYNCAILHGPYLENFQNTYDQLDAQNGAMLCNTAEDITNALVALQNPELTAKQCANAQRALTQTTQLETVLRALLERQKT